MLRRRETIIALRARWQAYRIASRMVHPRVARPDLPPDAPDGPEPPPKPVIYPSTEDTDISWLVLLVGVLLGFIFILVQFGR